MQISNDIFSIYKSKLRTALENSVFYHTMQDIVHLQVSQRVF